MDDGDFKVIGDWARGVCQVKAISNWWMKCFVNKMTKNEYRFKKLSNFIFYDNIYLNFI
jgi:hypothetical protein